jgi:RES domain-containing protein
VVLWRISNHPSLTGEGGLRTPGRWHLTGSRIVYCAESPAAAILEMLVRAGLAPAASPVHYRLLRIEAPDAISSDTLASTDLDPDWASDVSRTQTIGTVWLATAKTALLRVPSAVAPHTSNVLLNPAHPEAPRLTVAAVTDHVLDQRLLR